MRRAPTSCLIRYAGICIFILLTSVLSAVADPPPPKLITLDIVLGSGVDSVTANCIYLKGIRWEEVSKTVTREQARSQPYRSEFQYYEELYGDDDWVPPVTVEFKKRCVDISFARGADGAGSLLDPDRPGHYSCPISTSFRHYPCIKR